MKPEQMMLEYDFDADAQQQSLDALAEQIPSYVLGAVNDGRSTSLETVFGNECNDTPVTAAILETALIKLRDHRELKILNAD
jgi:hypothetical protein